VIARGEVVAGGEVAREAAAVADDIEDQSAKARLVTEPSWSLNRERLGIEPSWSLNRASIEPLADSLGSG